MRVIVFLWRVFFLFFVSHRLGIQVNSLQLVSEPRVRFEWEQWQRKQERHLESGKASGIENFDGTNFAYWRM